MKSTPISYRKFHKELRRAGHNVASINEITKALRRVADPDEALTRAYDWDFLLHPLRKQIKSMQSSKHKWSADHDREPVFSMYLTLLLKVRDRIEAAQTLNVCGLPIPEIAKQKGIGLQGLRWFAWAPDRVRAAVEKDFERLYNLTLADAVYKGRIKAVGKRLVPFSTAQERSASDVRWMRLWSIVTNQLCTRSGMPGQGVVLRALADALTVINNHGAHMEAPTLWEHLLSDTHRAELAAWKTTTLDGLAGGGMPGAVGQPLSQPADAEEISAVLTMRGVEKASLSGQKHDARKKAMREYAARRRKEQRDAGVLPVRKERVANDKAPVTTPQPPAGTRAWVDWVNERRVAMGNEPWTYAEHVTVADHA